jgi:hypothetical protein
MCNIGVPSCRKVGFDFSIMGWEEAKLRQRILMNANVTTRFLCDNQPDALIIQIYSVIKLYMFRASSLSIVRSFLLYIRHW